MDKAIKVFSVFADKDTIRIYKMLTKKMLTCQAIASVMERDAEYIQPILDKLADIDVIRILPGADKTYFSKNPSAVFDKYAKAIIELINKWYNQDEQIVNDFYKLNSMKK